LEQKGLLEINKITAQEISNYYKYISERPNKTVGGILSQKTTHSHMRIVRDFFIMLQKSEQHRQIKLKINPCSTLKFPYPKDDDTKRTILEQGEIKQLYKATETAQERAILSMSYGCGLRASELVNCNITDIRLREKILIVSKGKGNKRRVIPMSSGVIKDLSDYYYNEREELTKGRKYKSGDSAFMLNQLGSRMQKWTFNSHLKTIIERTKNQEIIEKEITTHNLRHSIATHLLEQGIPVEQVRMFLGHSQLETTQIYTHISRKQLQNLM
jgi:integrase/recombinase XerD